MIDRTFRADEKVEQAIIDKREMQFLYREGADYVFMDNETYDQLHVAADSARRRGRTTSRRATPRCCRCTTTRSSASTCPPRSSSSVTETEPGMQGDRVSGARKPATLETGLVVQVPLFVERRRAGQGRHPHRRVPDARLSAVDGRHGDAAAKRGSGPSASAYELELRDLARRRAARRAAGRRPTSTRERLVRGVDEHHDEIDALLAQVLRALGARAHAGRRPRRAAPRHATSSAGSPTSPTAVVITEAVELAKQYSTKDSGRFVNGLLARIAEERPARRRVVSAAAP